MENRVEYMMLWTALTVIATVMVLAWKTASKAIHWIAKVFARPVSLPAISPYEGTTVGGEQSEIFPNANQESPVSLALAEPSDSFPLSPEIDEPAASCAVVVREPASRPEFPRSLDWGRFERPTVIRKGLVIDTASRW